MQTNDLLPFIASVFQQMPFNQLLGLRVTAFSAERAEVRFQWKSELVGNPVQQILHGGVIASVLDVVGGEETDRNLKAVRMDGTIVHMFGTPNYERQLCMHVGMSAWAQI